MSSAGSSGNSSGSSGGIPGEMPAEMPGEMPGEMMPAKEPCTTDGAVRCAMRAAGQRDTCSGGFWTAGTACETGEICKSEPGPMDGMCLMVAEICRGSAGQPVCDSQGVMYQCSAEGVIESMSSCTSEKHCQLGLATKVCFTCIPGEFKCTEKKLEKCDADGMAFGLDKECATAALCNAKVGDCTDAACVPNKQVCEGDTLRKCNADQTALEDVKPCMAGLCDNQAGECDVCTPGKKTCEGDTVVTCNAQGQATTRAACSGATTQCVGSGQCVACAADADCGEPGTCKSRHCNLATGTCQPQNVMNGSECSAGVCKDGSCVGCLSPSDCDAAPGVCKVKGCSATNTCAPVNALDGSTCNTSDVCSGGNCVACRVPSDCEADPGVCKVKGCSAAGACAPANADDGSTCNGSNVCSGGRCVACRVPSDCDDDPGVCKVKGCSATGTCAPANAGNGTDCRTASGPGVCQGGTCIGCSTNTDCARLSPTKPFCSSSGTCVGCTSASQCDAPTCHTPTCSNGVCGDTIDAWASCGSNRVCDANGVCGASCPNGHIDSGEECEMGVGGWSSLNCEAASCQRSYYRTCSANGSCKEGSCGVTGGVCAGGCTTADNCPLAPEGSTVACYANFCALVCNSDSECPNGLHCESDPNPDGFNPKSGACVSSNCCTPDFGCAGCWFPSGV